MYKIRYFPSLKDVYYQVKDRKNIGTITIASNLVYGAGEYPIALEFAVAYSNPKDQFIKKVGRVIATARLTEKTPRYYVRVDLDTNRKMHFYEFDDIIYTYLKNIMRVPTWVDKINMC